jgi:acyl carrier protein phosphodiesterase
MNFLAHAYLSGTNPKILTGNFIADFVKGKQALKAFDHDIAKGIELHRLIDEFTDGHTVVQESKKRLRPKYRHYSAVIVDVFYDHFLASNWAVYHPQPLENFAADVYRTIGAFDDIVPAGIKHMMPYMIRGNWLVNYGKMEGIGRALTGMSRRTPYESKMDESIHDLSRDYDLYKLEFEAFFPELRALCDRWLDRFNQVRA